MFILKGSASHNGGVPFPFKSIPFYVQQTTESVQQ